MSTAYRPISSASVQMLHPKDAPDHIYAIGLDESGKFTTPVEMEPTLDDLESQSLLSADLDLMEPEPSSTISSDLSQIADMAQATATILISIGTVVLFFKSHPEIGRSIKRTFVSAKDATARLYRKAKYKLHPELELLEKYSGVIIHIHGHPSEEQEQESDYNDWVRLIDEEEASHQIETERSQNHVQEKIHAGL